MTAPLRPCLSCGRPTPDSRCGDCSAAKNRARGSSKQRGYGVEWQQVRAAVLIRDRFVCHWCGGRAATGDHLVPLACGGASTLANTVAACLSCNSGRGARGDRWTGRGGGSYANDAGTARPPFSRGDGPNDAAPSEAAQ